MICSFIEDENCKHNSFFLSSLYVFTGGIARSGEIGEIVKLSVLLDKVEISAQSVNLKDWINRSKHLIKYPNTYDYTFWGLGSKFVDWTNRGR